MEPLTSDFVDTDTCRLPAESVELVVAQPGLDFGPLEWHVAWAKNIVVARGKRYVSTREPDANSANFETWLSACPHAVGIMMDGKLRLPRMTEGSQDDPLQVLEGALSSGERELGRQIVNAGSLGLVLLLAGIGVIAGVLVEGRLHPFAPHLFEFGALGIALVIGGLLAGSPAMALMPQWSRIRRILAGLRRGGGLHASSLGKSIELP